MNDGASEFGRKLLLEKDKPFLRRLVELLEANGVSRQGQSRPGKGRPKGSTKYIGDINRSRCTAVDAVRWLLHERGFDSPESLNDRKIVDIVQELAQRGWNNEPNAEIIIELLAPRNTTMNSVLSSIRAGRSIINCRKNSE